MRRIIYLLLLLILFPLNVQAVSTNNRDEMDNLGVNKHWKITEKNRSNILNTYSVDSSLKVYDFGEIISDEDEKIIYEKINDLSNHINMDVVFLTVNIPYSFDKVNEDYAADFYDYNDFGIDKENYSGVLLLRNSYEADPYYNVYLFGNAQLYFDYERCEHMLDNIYDSFHSGNYVQGIDIFTDNFESYYDIGIASSRKNYIVDKDGYLKKRYVTPYGLITIISSVITLIIFFILKNKNKMVKSKLDTSKYVDKSGINLTTVTDTFINSYVTSHTRDTSSSGGHSSSGSSGGGHSSGGGRHG